MNVSLDHSELAPSFIPEDVTSKFELPNDLKADRIFIHKTASYENYIVISPDRVVAITPYIAASKPATILELQEGDKINDIASVGNTIILSSEEKMYYLVFRNMEYVFLGNKTPFPYIDFEKTDQMPTTLSVSKNYKVGDSWPEDADLWFDYQERYLPSDEEWNNDSKDGKEHENRRIKNCLTSLWESFAKVKTAFGRICRPIVIRYEVVTLEGKKNSVPILIPIGNSEIQAKVWKKRIDGGGAALKIDETVSLEDVGFYRVLAKFQQDVDLKNWADIISSIRIYVSVPLDLSVLKYSSHKLTIKEESYKSDYQTEGVFVNPTYESSASLTFYADPKYIDSLLLHSAETFLVKEIKVFDEISKEITPDFRALEEGLILDLEKFLNPSESGDQLQSQDMLIGDDMKHYQLTAKKLDVYNKRLILIQPSQTISYDYSRLNAYDKKKLKFAKQSCTDKYEITYILSGATEEKVVKAGPFIYLTDTIEEKSFEERIYPFQIFPDARAKKMIVKLTRNVEETNSQVVSYGEFDMRPHPYLDCAYYYGGFDETLDELCLLSSVEIPSVNAIDDTENKLIVSELEDPFTFPLEGKFTFQSKILGIAVATTALSQGQFGQFPIYVLTEDGIWAMETAADGSFVTSKPLSRDVCVNLDSITSIDNAVVFVTAQGVMMLQGSQVVNISPNMNGRHYQIENSARTIIEKQDFFCDLLPALSDNTHFLAFVKEATVAYDYAGKRLIFIKKDEKYQYIYKLDTQTWHKGAYDVDLVAPINSYPECLVQGKKDGKTRIYDLSTILDAAESKTPVRGVIATRPFDLGEPDVFKTITDVRIRGQFPKGAVKFILLGSNDGINFATVSTLRGRAWKLFRMVILADLAPTERISWVDIMYDTKFTNKLR